MDKWYLLLTTYYPQELMDEWGIASMLTETMSCSVIELAQKANMSYSYWCGVGAAVVLY